MLGGIVKRNRSIEVWPAFHHIACKAQRNTHEAMAQHERDCRPLFLGERHELRRKLAHHVAIERDNVRDPDAVEDREQQQRVFRRLPERLGLFDQQTYSGPRIGRFAFKFQLFIRLNATPEFGRVALGQHGDACRPAVRHTHGHGWPQRRACWGDARSDPDAPPLPAALDRRRSH